MNNEIEFCRRLVFVIVTSDGGDNEINQKINSFDKPALC